MRKSKKTIVYWAPVWDLLEDPIDWNMLYPEPECLLSVMLRDKVQRVGDDTDKMRPNVSANHNMFRCPAVSNVTKNTFLLKNPVETHIQIDPVNWDKKAPEGLTPELDNSRIRILSKNWIQCDIVHQSNLSDCTLFAYGLRWIFFTEDDSMNMNLTSPWFTNSPHLKYGAVVPGQFDIGKWFRSIALEYNVWPNDSNNEFKILADEVVGSVSFDTPNDIELVRFEMSESLIKYSRATASSSSWYSNVPLLKRFKMFEEAKMKRLILKEIKKNIV